MGCYTNIKCSAKVKKEYRAAISKLHKTNNWDTVAKEHSELSSKWDIENLTERAKTIPFWTSAYIPDCWNEGVECHYFNEENGHWLFVCSIKDLDNAIDSFIKIVIEKICFEVEFFVVWNDYGSPYGPDINITYDDYDAETGTIISYISECEIENEFHKIVPGINIDDSYDW